VRRACAELGLGIVTLQPFRDFEGMPAGQRERVFARAERKFDVMQELGTDLLMICSNVAPESLGGIDRAAADLRELGERAAKRGLRIAFEALAWGRHINDYRDSGRRCAAPTIPRSAWSSTPSTSWQRGTDLGAIRAIPATASSWCSRRRTAPADGLPVVEPSLPQLPGQGDLPVDDFMEALAATTYDGPLSLEIFNDQFRRLGAQPAVDGHRSLRFLLDQLGRRTGKRPAGAPVLPPRSRAEGVSFIEFSADDVDAPRLEGL
jgi:4-hydroxyphenylpyruvate dioxygenase